MRKDSPSLKATASQYLLSTLSRHLFVTVTVRDLMILLTQVAISLMPIVLQLPELSMQTDSLFLRDPKFIPVCMAELPSTFML